MGIEKTVKHESDVYALGTVTKGLIKGTGGLGNKRTNGDHQNYCIIEIGQNTEKSPGNLRRLVVAQTSVKDHKLTLSSSNNNNNNDDNKKFYNDLTRMQRKFFGKEISLSAEDILNRTKIKGGGEKRKEKHLP